MNRTPAGAVLVVVVLSAGAAFAQPEPKAEIGSKDAETSTTKTKVIPFQEHAILQVRDTADEVALEVDTKSRGLLGAFVETVTVFRTPDAREFTLSIDRDQEKDTYAWKLKFPDGRTLSFDRGARTKGDTLQSLAEDMFPNSKFKLGSKNEFLFTIGRPLKPQFETKEALMLREQLPPSLMEVSTTLADANRGLTESGQSVTSGFAGLFIDLALGKEQEFMSGKKGIDVRIIKNDLVRISGEAAQKRFSSDAAKKTDETAEESEKEN